jgi:hypothetical protein
LESVEMGKVSHLWISAYARAAVPTSQINKAFIMMLAVLSVSVHAAKSKYVVLSSGERGYSIRCDNENINACYEMAGETCHRGYTILERNKETGYLSEGSASINALGGNASAISTTTTEKSLLIQCKESELTEKEHGDRARQTEQEEIAKQESRKRELEEGARGARWFFGGIVGALALAGVIAIIVVIATK